MIHGTEADNPNISYVYYTSYNFTVYNIKEDGTYVEEEGEIEDDAYEENDDDNKGKKEEKKSKY